MQGQSKRVGAEAVPRSHPVSRGGIPGQIYFTPTDELGQAKATAFTTQSVTLCFIMGLSTITYTYS